MPHPCAASPRIVRKRIPPTLNQQPNLQVNLPIFYNPIMPPADDKAVSDLIHAIGLLIRRLRAAIPSHELSLSERSALRRLETEGPATIADLARAERVRPQSMGATIAALEDAALIQRTPHPTDGRQVLIRITPAGAVLRKDTKDARHAWLAQAISHLTPEEQATLFRAAEILRRIAEQ